MIIKTIHGKLINSAILFKVEYSLFLESTYVRHRERNIKYACVGMSTWLEDVSDVASDAALADWESVRELRKASPSALAAIPGYIGAMQRQKWHTINNICYNSKSKLV